MWAQWKNISEQTWKLMAEDARGPQGDLDVRPWWNAESLALRSEVIKLSEDSLFVLCMCHGGWLHMNCNQEINLERQKNYRTRHGRSSCDKILRWKMLNQLLILQFVQPEGKGGINLSVLMVWMSLSRKDYTLFFFFWHGSFGIT